jgi:plastocyanin
MILGAVAALCAVVALASAQQTVPTLAVNASPTAVAVQAPGPVPAGPTRFDVTRQGTKDLSLYVVLLNAGVSQQEFENALSSDDRTGGESAAGLASIQGSTAVIGTDTRRAMTFTLKPGLTYLVVAEGDQPNSGGPTPRAITTLTTSAESNGATAAAPDATVRMAGLRFRGDSVLPRRGVVRFQNADGVPHFALAFPLRSKVTSKQFARAVQAGSQRAFGRVVSGNPYGLQNIISGGNTANDNEVQFAKAGRYGLVCFFDEHHRLGMYRIVTVK